MGESARCSFRNKSWTTSRSSVANARRVSRRVGIGEQTRHSRWPRAPCSCRPRASIISRRSPPGRRGIGASPRGSNALPPCGEGAEPVSWPGSQPMWADPCTLFCPRRGFTPLPGLPKLPVSSARLTRHITPSVPCTCSVRPRPWTHMDGLSEAYRRAAARMRSAVTPRARAPAPASSADRSDVSASRSLDALARTPGQSVLRGTMTWASAFSSGTFVPGRSARCTFA